MYVYDDMYDCLNHKCPSYIYIYGTVSTKMALRLYIYNVIKMLLV